MPTATNDSVGYDKTNESLLSSSFTMDELLTDFGRTKLIVAPSRMKRSIQFSVLPDDTVYNTTLLHLDEKYR